METLALLKKQLLQMLATLQTLHPLLMPHKEHLYDVATSFLGRDASPNDLAPDEYGCAETVSNIIRSAFPELNFPIMLSTRQLFAHLLHSPSFQRIVTEPAYGDIILSATGTGNGSLHSGHTGIVGKYGVLSNDSRSGLFLENYSLASWKLYFEGKGGFPTYFFRPV